MAVTKYKPTSSGRRHSSVQDFSDITKTKPEKSLITTKKKNSGRNNVGKITIRHRGGGTKRFYRHVDFARINFDIPLTVIAIEYDPNRGPRIALMEDKDGNKSYILAEAKMKVGDVVVSSKKKIEAKPGNRMPLEFIPSSLNVYNVEMEPGKGGQMVRGAGNSAQLMVIEGKYAQLRLPSTEVRLFAKECMATVGQLSNSDYKLVRWGKAGRMRYKGFRPTVTGKNMNAVDHPHGGGEGHSPIGLRRGPRTKWGKPALGVKTRKPKQSSSKFIISRRKSKKKK
ncbi:MAG: 50S ribosomal protein L2 [Candidatus Magasanikbacteria bacterium CG_4_10_14_0_8_um_filter_32_14]|uniref:Large ribosomal subunit protein uL2 n=1 Tax=Candidatus Magasanikbacteria bacterium CG_4_10_14_0_8_um_filter_32_14 TaxID=1974640 RepID=A0A2M7R9H5_9BACT|nr:MAG: 50S ribosomal protein L2 [Candidatus Magasanikbacteria bacterium CG_4_10_14_0_8_um_filter_32_14]